MANTMTALREIPSGSLSGDESSGDIIIDLVRTANLSKLDQGLPLKEENLRCPDCSFSCSDSSTLATHIFSRTDGTPWKCEECSFKSCTTTDLLNHKRSLHSIASCNTNPTVQDKNKSVNNKNSVTETSPLFKCDSCSFSSPFRAAYNEHKRWQKGVPRLCSKCDYTSCSSFGLKSHRVRQHGLSAEIKKTCKHVCLYCRKRFLRKRNLEQHMRIHTGEKRFKCQLCSFESKQEAHITRHEKIHLRGFPLKCKYCCATFDKLRFLKAHHKRSHDSNP